VSCIPTSPMCNDSFDWWGIRQFSGDAGARYHTQTAAEKGSFFTLSACLHEDRHHLNLPGWLQESGKSNCCGSCTEDQERFGRGSAQIPGTATWLKCKLQFFVNLLFQVEVYELGCLSPQGRLKRHGVGFSCLNARGIGEYVGVFKTRCHYVWIHVDTIFVQPGVR